MTAPIGGNPFTPSSTELDSMPSATEEGPFIQVRLSEYEELQNTKAALLKKREDNEAIIQQQSRSIDRITKDNKKQSELTDKEIEKNDELTTANARLEVRVVTLERLQNTCLQEHRQQPTLPPVQTATQDSLARRAWNGFRGFILRRGVVEAGAAVTAGVLAICFPQVSVPIVCFLGAALSIWQIVREVLN